MSERSYGRVVWFKDHKGIGYIRPDTAKEGERDLFFHYSYLQMKGYKTIKPNTKVSYGMGVNHEGPMAIDIVAEPEETADAAN